MDDYIYIWVVPYPKPLAHMYGKNTCTIKQYNHTVSSLKGEESSFACHDMMSVKRWAHPWILEVNCLLMGLTFCFFSFSGFSSPAGLGTDWPKVPIAFTPSAKLSLRHRVHNAMWVGNKTKHQGHYNIYIYAYIYTYTYIYIWFHKFLCSSTAHHKTQKQTNN